MLLYTQKKVDNLGEIVDNLYMEDMTMNATTIKSFDHPIHNADGPDPFTCDVPDCNAPASFQALDSDGDVEKFLCAAHASA